MLYPIATRQTTVKTWFPIFLQHIGLCQLLAREVVSNWLGDALELRKFSPSIGSDISFLTDKVSDNEDFRGLVKPFEMCVVRPSMRCMDQQRVGRVAILQLRGAYHMFHHRVIMIIHYTHLLTE